MKIPVKQKSVFPFGSMAKYIANKLPNSHLICLPDTGHLWILDHIKEVLEPLIAEDEELV